MRIEALRLRSFRAHADSAVEFGPGINLIVGPNGAGKTNLLEAVHYLCLSKSFLASSDGHVLRRGDPHFVVEGRFSGERRADLSVRLAFIPGEGKRAFVNKAPLERLADLVGLIPVVVLSPDDHVLTAGGPEERRRFMDNVLSQARPSYLQDVMRYRRVLRQRNALLLAERTHGTFDAASYRAWTSELVSLGARIMTRRAEFVEAFSKYLDDAYQHLEAVGERPAIRYQTAVDLDSPAQLDPEAAFSEVLDSLARKERRRGRTLAGPHRDELVFTVNDHEVRPYASQGQHRTFALALKLATFAYLNDLLEERPILLLDDVLGILDQHRRRVILEMLQKEEAGQCLITATSVSLFDDVLDINRPDHRLIEVDNGRVGAPQIPERKEEVTPSP